MARKLVSNPDGSVTITDDFGKNPDGTPAGRTWTVNPLAPGKDGAPVTQLDKMARTLTSPNDPQAPAAQQVSAGDLSATADFVNAQLKQLAS